MGVNVCHFFRQAAKFSSRDNNVHFDHKHYMISQGLRKSEAI